MIVAYVILKYDPAKSARWEFENLFRSVPKKPAPTKKEGKKS